MVRYANKRIAKFVESRGSSSRRMLELFNAIAADQRMVQGGLGARSRTLRRRVRPDHNIFHGVPGRSAVEGASGRRIRAESTLRR